LPAEWLRGEDGTDAPFAAANQYKWGAPAMLESGNGCLTQIVAVLQRFGKRALERHA